MAWRFVSIHRLQSFWGGHPNRMLAALTVGLGTARLSRRVLPPLLPAIIGGLGITPFAAGIALSLLSIWRGLLQYPSGRLADQLTRKTVLLASLGVLLVGSIVLSMTLTYTMFLFGVALIGVGEGLYGPAERALLADLFQENRGSAFGIHSIASDISGIVAAGLAIFVLTVATWQMAFLPSALLAALVIVLFYRWGREPIIVERVTVGIGETVYRLFGEFRFRLLVIAYSLFTFSIKGFIAFLPTFLQIERGLSPVFANGIFALLYALGIVVKPVSGGLSDRVARTYVGTAGLGLTGIGIAIVIGIPTTVGAIVGVVVLGSGQKAFPPVMQAHLMDVFPDSSMGGDLGATRTVYFGLASLGPAYVGYVASQLNYTAAYSGFLLCILFAGGITLWLSLTE